MTDKAKAARAEYMREYRKKNPEKIAAYMREYRKKNPEKIAACMLRYWEKKALRKEAETNNLKQEK